MVYRIQRKRDALTDRHFIARAQSGDGFTAATFRRFLLQPGKRTEHLLHIRAVALIVFTAGIQATGQYRHQFLPPLSLLIW